MTRFLTAASALALIVTTGCSGDDALDDPTAEVVAGAYVGQITGPVTDLAYPITVAKVGRDAVSVSGADFSTVEFELAWAGADLITEAEGSEGTLSYIEGELDFTTGGLTFQGNRSGGGGTTGGTNGGGNGGTNGANGGGNGGTNGGNGGTNGGTGGGDCNVTVPADVVVVTSGSQQAANNLDVLVCPGASLDGSANTMNVYALDGAGVNVFGDNNTLWAEEGVQANVTGSNNTATVQQGATTVVISGANSDKLSCDNLVIDISMVPGGC